MNPIDNLPTDEERKILYGAVNGFLKSQWPVERAVARASSPEAVAEIWRGLCQQGLATLGTEPGEGGLREILLVMEALGRASCPAPMLEAALANLALWGRHDKEEAVSGLLEALHGGEALLSVAFGAYDHDAGAGSVRVADNTVVGKVNAVASAGVATHILAFSEDGPSMVVVERRSPGIDVTPTPGLAVPPLSNISFDKCPAIIIPLTAARIQELNLIYRLGLAARAEGAARQCFELLVEYVKERKQFGRSIGSFQAIQHKMANCLMYLDGVRLTVEQAATSHDLGSPDWTVFASAAYANASPALRQVSLETHHTFGAIGYAEEHEAPRHFRRVHADMVRCGGVLRAREELAGYLLGPAD